MIVRSASLSASLRSLVNAIDPVAWCRSDLQFSPEPWQCDVLRSTAPRVALNCSRQAGKSTIAAALALHTAQYRPGSLVLVAAPSLRQSSELYRKVHAFIAQLATPPELAEQNASTITLANGSRLVCIPTSEATLRGFSNPTLVILDEASRIDDSAVEAIRPMLANGGGRLLMMSTPFGQAGSFFECWTSQRAFWEWHTVPATAIARISSAWLDQERRAMHPRVFAREYECTFAETDGALFDLDQIAACMTDAVQPLFGPNGSLAQRQLPGLLSSAVQPLAV